MSGRIQVLNDQQLATIMASMALSLTVGGVSNPPLLAEPSCLGMVIDPETGTECGRVPEDILYASVADSVAGV